LLDVDGISECAERAIGAWTTKFKYARLAYSYKTNALKAVTSCLADKGYAAETVSVAEVGFALDDQVRAGIFLGGPTLTRPDFAAGIAVNATIKIDSLDQLRDAISAAGEGGRQLNCVFRLATFRNERWSRFGLLPDEVAPALARVDAAENARVLGMHFHLGSNVLETDSYARTALLHLPALNTLLGRRVDRPVILSIGGGFPSHSWNADGSPPDLSEVGTELQAALAPHINLEAVEFIAEPGRALVEDYGVLVMRVVSVKKRPAETNLFADGGTNLIHTLHLWRHPVEIVVGVGVELACHYDIYGSQCFEADKFAEAVAGPPNIVPGAVVMVYEAGAYDINGAGLWMRSGPPVIIVRNGELRQARGPYDIAQIRGIRT
jgi:diaminopimelate decarboxylase